MKKLTIEQKAKAYDEAIERAKNTIEVNQTIPDIVECVESLFPELKESEDERIRKAIIHFISHTPTVPKGIIGKKTMLAWLEKQGEKHIDKELSKLLNNVICMFINNPLIPYSERDEVSKKIIPYVEQLEKQGEQRSADKVEPKFQNGQCIVWQNKCYKVNYNGCGYELVDQNGLSTSLEYGTVDGSAHLWDITKDAKDGDVLCIYECCEPKIVFILKGTPKKHYALGYHCYYNIMYPHFASDSEKGCLAPNDEDVKPATEEQYDVLMKAMADTGYTFDFEKKELRKIEQKTSEWKQENNKFLTKFENAMLHVGESFFGKNHGLDPNNTGDVKEQAALLMELANNYSGWTEEDDKFLKDISLIVNEYYSQYFNGITNVDRINWLKSIKQRYIWRPSDEQMKRLKGTINSLPQQEVLYSLYQDLKKLREE